LNLVALVRDREVGILPLWRLWRPLAYRKSERVALVGVVIFIDGNKYIFGVEEETIGSCACGGPNGERHDRETSAELIRVGNCAEVGEWLGARIAHGVRILGDDGNGADIGLVSE